MSFIAKNPLIIPEIDSPPSTPKLGTRGIFAGKDGWYEIDSDDNVKKLATEQYMEQTIVQDLTSPSSNKVPSAEAVAREISYKEDKSNKLTFADLKGDLGTLNVTDDQYLSALVAQIMHDTLKTDLAAVKGDIRWLESQIGSSGGGSIDTSNFLTPGNISRWIDEDLATDHSNNSVPNVYALVDYVKGKTDSKRITDREDILPITSAPDGAWYMNNDNYPSMLYLDKCFEQFRSEIGNSGGSGSGSIDTSEFLTVNNISRLIEEDKMPANPYEDGTVPNSYAVAAYVKERTDDVRIKSGMTPLTQAYAEGAGYVSDEHHPSMKYMALSLEQFRNEIIASLGGGSSTPSVKKTSVTLQSAYWKPVEGSEVLYHQSLSIDGVTANSMIDLQPTPTQLAVFYEKDVTFVTENDNGAVTVYCIGQKPMNDYTIQATITEVER